MKIKDALQLYFSKYHFENGGYDLKWFKIKVGPVFIPLPNTKARIDAVKIHDIHHLVTEFPATLRGEAEIGAWEIASGCGRYYAAWLLNFGSFFYGMFFFPKLLFRAFLKGRHCKTNLYHGVKYDEELLHRTIGAVREGIGIDDPEKATAMDYLSFVFYCLLILTLVFVFSWACYFVVKLALDCVL